MGDYQRLQTEAENEVQMGNVPRQRSREDLYYAKPMSKLQKIAFALSIISCAAVIIIFLWVLPCDLDTCSDNNDGMNIFSWNKTLPALELKGQLHYVGGNLIGILRGALWGKTGEREFPPHSGGVIALDGKSGQVVWKINMGQTSMPLYLDCSLLDINPNGVKDCLVLGDNGYLAAVTSAEGLKWVMNTSNESDWPQPKDIDLPVSLPDMDKDGYSDLGTLSRFSGGTNRLAFVSSKTGSILSEPKLSSECYQVYNLTFEASTATAYYTCTKKDGGYSVLSFPIEGVSKPRNKTAVWTGAYLKRKWEEDEGEGGGGGGGAASGGGAGEHRVIVSNTGSCPAHCSVSVNVTDPRNQTIWSYLTDKAYVMSPVSLHFKQSITGFLLKLWQWHTTNHRTLKNGENDVRIELIKERIVLITFSKSGNMHVVNASQTDITQLCNATECQPQLSFQTQSAVIADVNGDGSQDLISYFVSYKHSQDDIVHDTGIEEWELESSVRVVRLEAELPKLYDAVSNKH